MIVVIYRSVDGVHRVKRFGTLPAAQAFAWHCVGKHPDIGSTYAVSFDGIGTIMCEGCTLEDLFPQDDHGVIEP